jgi:prephenate dehydrogenase
MKGHSVTFVGLGLIGGSMALDLRRSGFASSLAGIDRDSAHAERAVQRGLVDEIRKEGDLAGADVIVLSIPVNALVALLPAILDSIRSDTVVIDTGSTKRPVCRAVASHPKRMQFVAAHPIAGTENSGPDAAVVDLFREKINIICESERSSPQAMAVARELFAHLGSRTIFMEPDEHDRHVAYVSHLSHVSSFLLGHTVLDIEKDEKNIFELAGSGFASTVRLAKSSPDMWAPIFEQNAEYLSQALQEYIMHLQRFHYHLMKKDSRELGRIMKEANRIRRVLEGIDLKAGNGKQPVPLNANE